MSVIDHRWQACLDALAADDGEWGSIEDCELLWGRASEIGSEAQRSIDHDAGRMVVALFRRGEVVPFEMARAYLS